MKRDYEVWFAIPSASVERCRKVLPKWREKGYKIAILQNYEAGEVPADIVQWSDTYPGWAQSINILSKQIVPKSADLIVSGGCDMLPDPNHTAQELAEQFYDHFPDGFGVMQPHGDAYGNARHYCGSPFFGRKWIDTMYQGEGPMHGGYKHNWGDVELYWVSKCLGALWDRRDLTHFHDHFKRETNAKKPAWWIANVERNDRHDVELLLNRKRLLFPGHEPVGVDREMDPAPILNDTVRLAEKHYRSNYSGGIIGLVEQAIQNCAAKGLNPVAIYGAGRHTLSASEALAQPAARIDCIIDDNPARHGTKLWNYDIVSQAEAVRRGVRAVILSSDAHEEKLFASCAPLRAKGIEVVTLYDCKAVAVA